MILLLSILLANPAVLAEVDQLFGYGGDHAREVQALDILEREVAAAPTDYDLLWRIARSSYYTGTGVPQKQRVSYFERGIEAGKKAVALKPDGVEGHFWLGAVWGGFLQEKGGLTAFRNVKNVRSEMEAVLRLDDTYESAGAYTALGEIDRQLPGLFGGNIKRSVATLEKGLTIAPNNLTLKLALAKAYHEAKRKADALVQVNELLAFVPTSKRTPLERKAQENARVFLRELNKK